MAGRRKEQGANGRGSKVGTKDRDQGTSKGGMFCYVMLGYRSIGNALLLERGGLLEEGTQRGAGLGIRICSLSHYKWMFLNGSSLVSMAHALTRVRHAAFVVVVLCNSLSQCICNDTLCIFR